MQLASVYGFIQNIAETKASNDGTVSTLNSQQPYFYRLLVCMDEEGLPKLVIEVKKSTFHPARLLK